METEITVQVFNTDSDIKSILKSQNFEIVENYSLIDYYFSKYSLSAVKKMSYKSLLKNSFLVRKILSNEQVFEICYKNKILNKDNEVIMESKIVCHIGEPNSAIEIFKSAKLTNWCISNNNSVIYKKGNICFSLQCIEDLGIFIEYEEDETMKELSLEEKRMKMKNILQNLGLNLGSDFSCKKPYMLLHQKNN